MTTSIIVEYALLKLANSGKSSLKIQVPKQESARAIQNTGLHVCVSVLTEIYCGDQHENCSKDKLYAFPPKPRRFSGLHSCAQKGNLCSFIIPVNPVQHPRPNRDSIQAGPQCGRSSACQRLSEVRPLQKAFNAPDALVTAPGMV